METTSGTFESTKDVKRSSVASNGYDASRKKYEYVGPGRIIVRSMEGWI